MSAPPSLSRAEFECLLAEHGELVRLASDLEYRLYRLGESATPERVLECQQAGGALVGLLRAALFRHDQQVLPVLEALAGTPPP